MSHTFATLGLSQPAYDEIARKLKVAGYHHAFRENGVIDMRGIDVVVENETVEISDLPVRHGNMCLCADCQYKYGK